MIDVLYTVLQKFASPRWACLLLGCLLLVMLLIAGKPCGVAQLKSLSGGVGMLDMEISYSPQEAYALFEALGEEGRAFYLRRFLPLDMLYPLVYSLFFMTAATIIFQKIFSEENPWRKLSVFTILAGLFDYLENLCVLIMLLSYPKQLTQLAGLANIFTLSKFGFILVNIVLLSAGLLGLIVRGREKKQEKEP